MCLQAYVSSFTGNTLLNVARCRNITIQQWFIYTVDYYNSDRIFVKLISRYMKHVASFCKVGEFACSLKMFDLGFNHISSKRDKDGSVSYITQEWSVSFLNSSLYQNYRFKELGYSELYKEHLKQNQSKELDEFTLKGDYDNFLLVLAPDYLFNWLLKFKAPFQSYFWHFNC